MADRWEPTKYTDDYVAALMKVIEAKAEGEVVRAPKAKAPRPTNVVDLVERLRASLAQAQGAGARHGRKSTSFKIATSRRTGARPTRARKAKRAAKGRRHVA